MVNNYDKIANQYDTLSRLVFGKAQVNAQINQLKYLPGNSSILLVGGGTGWILEEISKLHASGLKITYVEISAKMIALSKARNIRNNSVDFANIAIENFKTDISFDVILTPFLFDNFNRSKAVSVFKKLGRMLNEQGIWFLVDFSLNVKNGRWWKWLMLKAMYLFFKLIRIVEASKLIDMSPYFLKDNYQILEEQFYYGSFIKASVFKKNDSHLMQQ